MTDLIATLEGLTSPSREVDALIATTIGGYVYEKRDSDRKPWFYPKGKNGFRRQLHSAFQDRLPAYTASMDAVLSLVEDLFPSRTFQIINEGLRAWSKAEGAPRDLPRFVLLVLVRDCDLLRALEARDGTE